MGKLAIACSIIIPRSSNAERAYGAYQAASGIYSGARKQGAQSREETSSQSYNWAATQNDLGLIFIAAGQIQTLPTSGYTPGNKGIFGKVRRTSTAN